MVSRFGTAWRAPVSRPHRMSNTIHIPDTPTQSQLGLQPAALPWYDIPVCILSAIGPNSLPIQIFTSSWLATESSIRKGGAHHVSKRLYDWSSECRAGHPEKGWHAHCITCTSYRLFRRPRKDEGQEKEIETSKQRARWQAQDRSCEACFTGLQQSLLQIGETRLMILIVRSKTVFAGFHLVYSHPLPDGALLLLATVATRTATVFQRLAIQKTRGGYRPKQYGDMLGMMVQVVTGQLVGTARRFIAQWNPQELCNSPRSGGLEQRKQGALIIEREATIVLYSIWKIFVAVRSGGSTTLGQNWEVSIIVFTWSQP